MAHSDGHAPTSSGATAQDPTTQDATTQDPTTQDPTTQGATTQGATTQGATGIISRAPSATRPTGAATPSSSRTPPPVRRSTTPDLDTITDTAAHLFHERGYQNTTMQDLAEALGIAKPTLYTHARSKLEILGRILDRVLAEAQGVIDAAAAQEDPLEALRMIIVGQTGLSVTYRAYYSVFQGDQRELPTPLRRKYRAWSRQYVEAVRTVILRGQDSGTFRSDVDPLVIAYAVIGTTNWAARWVRPRGRLPVDTVSGQFTTLVLEGLVAGDDR